MINELNRAVPALQVEAHRPGTIPQELLVSLSSKVSANSLTVRSLPRLEGEAIEYLEEVEALLDQSDDLTRLVAYAEVKSLLRGKSISPKSIRSAQNRIQQNIDCFRTLINPKQKGGVAA